MATAANPFIGSGWTPAQDPNAGGVLGNPLFNPGAQPPAAGGGGGNPSNRSILGWPGQNVNNDFGASSAPSTSPVSGPPVGPWGNPGKLPNPTSNIKDITRNTGYLNLLKGQFGLSTAEDFLNLMKGYAGPAGDFFKTLMNLGSPFYQQKQSNVFDTGVKANQDAAAMTNQELASRGYGYTPSGVNAAAIGAQNVVGGQNLVQNFLNTLFQNEQLQTAGAQDLSQLAGMFNPAQFLGNTSTPGSTQGPSAGDVFANIMGSIFGGGGFNKKNFGG